MLPVTGQGGTPNEQKNSAYTRFSRTARVRERARLGCVALGGQRVALHGPQGVHDRRYCAGSDRRGVRRQRRGRGQQHEEHEREHHGRRRHSGLHPRVRLRLRQFDVEQHDGRADEGALRKRQLPRDRRDAERQSRHRGRPDADERRGEDEDPLLRRGAADGHRPQQHGAQLSRRERGNLRRRQRDCVAHAAPRADQSDSSGHILEIFSSQGRCLKWRKN